MSTCASFGRRRPARPAPGLVIALLLLAGCVPPAHAQDVTEVTLKGAFLFNFARFTEWPADALPTDATVSACILGDRPVAEAFSRTVRGKQLAGRSIAVTMIAPEASLPVCHLLYVSNLAASRIAEIVAALRGAPVLTISDSEQFTARGGIIQVFVESGKMRFRINSRSAKRAGLQLSSRLLALAEVVDEDAAAVAEAPLTHLLISAGPGAAIERDLDSPGIDWARRFTAWKRN